MLHTVDLGYLVLLLIDVRTIARANGENGKTYKNATIVGPAPAPVPPEKTYTPAQVSTIQSVEKIFNENLMIKSPPASNKIPWSDWTLVIQATWETAMLANMPPAEAVALVNTTLIAYSNGKLETPSVDDVLDAQYSQADPTLKSELKEKEDDIPWG